MMKPYAFINHRLTNYATLKSETVTGSAASAKFDVLNGHIRDAVVLPGQLVIVGNSSIRSCTLAEAALMRSAADTRMALMGMSATNTTFMTKNYDLLQSLLSYGSIGVGSASSAWAKHLSGVKGTLQEVTELRRRYPVTVGAAPPEAFLVKRRALLTRLDTQLDGAARYGTGLRSSKSIEPLLGARVQAFVHSTAMQQYTNSIKRISRGAKYLSKGAYVGITLDVGASALEMVESCTVGREELCAKVKYVEAGKVTLGVLGSSWGGTTGAMLGVGICSALAVPTMGGSALACAIIGGAVGGFTVGKAGSFAGEHLGTFVYEKME